MRLLVGFILMLILLCTLGAWAVVVFHFCADNTCPVWHLYAEGCFVIPICFSFISSSSCSLNFLKLCGGFFGENRRGGLLFQKKSQNWHRLTNQNLSSGCKSLMQYLTNGYKIIIILNCFWIRISWCPFCATQVILLLFVLLRGNTSHTIGLTDGQNMNLESQTMPYCILKWRY